jgi:broad specificity phosphatase PhoE
VVPADEEALLPLDVAPLAGRGGRVVTSPARRCRVDGADADARLGPWELGSWHGRDLADLPPDDLVTWRSHPTWSGHGGESLTALAARVASLLDAWHGLDDRLVAVTHAAVVKAAVVTALRAPVDAVWDVDVAPASVTELHPTDRGWRVTRVGARWSGPAGDDVL